MYHQPLKNKLLIVEGNIGAGKSTILKILGGVLNVSIIPEPTEKWQNVKDGHNVLDLFYKDTKRWAYTFQSYAFLTRLNALFEEQKKASSPEQIFILERSVYCDRFCFAKNCFEAGLMTALEWHIYKEWFAWLVQNFAPRPHGFIYLRTDPTVAHARTSRRHRQEEDGIKLDYLQALHDKHEDWLVNKKEVGTLQDIPVLVLDCNPDFEFDHARREILIGQITAFISSLDELEAGTVSMSNGDKSRFADPV